MYQLFTGSEYVADIGISSNMHDRRRARAQRARWRNSRASARRIHTLDDSKAFDTTITRSDYQKKSHHGNVETSRSVLTGLTQKSTVPRTSKTSRRHKISNVLEQVICFVQ